LAIANSVGIANWIQRRYDYGKNASGRVWNTTASCTYEIPFTNNIRFDNPEPINGCN